MDSKCILLIVFFSVYASLGAVQGTLNKITETAGKTVTLACDGTTGETLIRWYRNDTASFIAEKAGSNTKVASVYRGRLAVDGAKVLLKNVKVNDSAFYYCTSGSNNGVAHSFTQLIVKESNKNEATPHKISTTSGNSVKLLCDTALKDVQVTAWYRNDSTTPIVQIKHVRKYNTGKDYKGRVKVEGNNLILTDVTIQDSAFYYCISTRQDRSLFGNFVQLVVKELRFLEFTALLGTTITLPCSTNHKDYLLTEWYRNDTNAEIAQIQKSFTYVHPKYTGRLDFDGKNLILKSCQVADSGFYYCKTVNDQKQSLEGHSFIKLMVKEIPSCGQVVASVSTMNGTSPTLSCVVKGNPKPEIKWFKSDNPTGSLGPRFVATRAGLLINKVIPEDSGTYQVTLKNDAGIFTYKFELEVKSSNDVKPENFKTTNENKLVVLPCGTFPVKPGRDSVSWQKVVGKIDSDRVTTLLNGSLVIKSATRQDDGWYTCVIKSTDEHGVSNRKVNIYLEVNYAPVIFNIRKMVAVFVKEVAVLPCSSKGHPDIAYRWLDGRGNPISDKKRFSVSTNGSLIVYNVQMEDQMNYTCAPYNQIGDGISKKTELIVKKSPEFTDSLKSTEITVDEQGKASLNCLFTGFPIPTITWKRNGKALNKSVRIKIGDDGLLRISNIVVDDTGTYTCYVSSIAGQLSRQISLVVIGKPGTPINPEVRVTGKTAFIEWTRSYNGGSPQTFEIWIRDESKDDYTGWYVKGNNTSNEDETTISKLEETSIHLDKLIEGFNENADRSTYFISIRARNSKGYSCFSKVVKLLKLAKEDVAKGSPIPKYIDPKPLAPHSVVLNITKEGYALNWKLKQVPGRPVSAFIVIKYRGLNSQSEWEELRRLPVASADCDSPSTKQQRRRRRSIEPEQLTITQDELDTNEVQEFQVVSEARDGEQCEPQTTNVNFIAKPAMTPPPEDDTVIPIVLGSILAVFVVILLISLYCFCRKRKQNRYAARKNERANMVTYTKENGIHTAREEECEMTDKAQLLDDYDSPKRFHLRTCPALKLGQYSTNGNVMNGSNKDQVYILLQRYEEEKELCTCNKRYLTLDSRDQKTKRDKKKGIYKSNSSPDIMLTSDMDGSSIDPSDLLDEEGYDLSDIEKDEVGELNNPVRYPTLNRQNFKDSYDQFCRDGSTSKDGRHRLSSEEKTEADKNLDQRDGIMMKENDLSSENSATESERVLTPKGKELADNRRSFDGKSSGYGEGSNSTSDSESVHELKKPSSARNPPYPMGYVSDTGARRDYGYASDISTRSSPLDYKGRPRYQPPSQRHRLGGYEPMQGHYFSEDESVRSGNSSTRPVQPPPYNIALHDIERLSEKNDITDSEEMYDHLLDMGRQLGVTLDDSIESDLNNKVMMPPPRSYSNPRAFPPPPPAVESGYMTDTSLGGKDRYTDREKSERCAQLLNEFKSTRNNMSGDDYNENDDEETPVQPPTLRSRSVMDNMTFEEPHGPPALKRSNSTGASGVYKEWLV